MESALEELVAAYKTELGLSDKEADQLEHLQVSIQQKQQPQAAFGYRDYSGTVMPDSITAFSISFLL